MATAKEYANKIKKQPEINTTLKKGIHTVTINNALNISTDKINQAKKELLSKAINDEQILDIMTQEDNMRKIATRLEYLTTLQSQGEHLITCTKFNTTPIKYIQELNNYFKQYETIDATVKSGSAQRKLWLIGCKAVDSLNKKGELSNIKITIILRKA